MHYSVLVVGDDVEEKLAPFKEGDLSDLPFDLLAFDDDEDEYREKYETDSVEKVVTPDGRLLLTWDDAFKVKKHANDLFPTTVIPENLERRHIPFKEMYSTFEEFMSDWCGYKSRDARTGRYGHWRNPNGKWDWYSIGGRWNGALKLKPGATSGKLGDKASIHPSGCIGSTPLPIEQGFVDSAIKSEVDFPGMDARDRDRIASDYRRYIAATDEEKSTWWVEKDWPPLPGETVDQFIERHHEPWGCYALLVNGVWHERETWNGKDWIKRDNWKREFWTLLNDVPDTERITVVDIHS